MNQRLFEFIKESPTAFHTVSAVVKRLSAAGYSELKENEKWDIQKGGKYYITRNNSSIISFSISQDLDRPSFRIAASHGDSPAFKLKENSALELRNKYVRLDTEGYGGMICYSWLDRPLSVAGRIVYMDKKGTKSCLKEKLVDIDRDIAVIPSLAVHMDRKINDGKSFNKQTDTIPLFSGGDGEIKDIKSLIASEYEIDKENIISQDLFLYNRMEGKVWGANNEFISAPMLDDLMCAFASLEAFIESGLDTKKKKDKSKGKSNKTKAKEFEETGNIKVYACFDNEEVGSSTRQGAASTFLSDVLERICDNLGYTRDEYHQAIAESMMLSEDNGHAVHPNHPEKADAVNSVYMNEGIVIKSNASQKYTTDALGMAVCKMICKEYGIPVQYFANRSDEPGGSTLGNISACQVPVCTVDIGLAQLSMHSAYETAGAKDCEYMKIFTKAFYERTDIKVEA